MYMTLLYGLLINSLYKGEIVVTKMAIDSYVYEYDFGCQSARAMTTEPCM